MFSFSMLTLATNYSYGLNFMPISNVQQNIDHNISMVRYIFIFIELWTEYINLYAVCTVQEKTL